MDEQNDPSGREETSEQEETSEPEVEAFLPGYPTFEAYSKVGKPSITKSLGPTTVLLEIYIYIYIYILYVIVLEGFH